MSSAVAIRQALVSDVPALSVLLEELGFPSTEHDIAERLDALPDMVLVAVRAGKVIGLVTMNVMSVLHREAPVGRLSALVVLQPERGKGVGKALVTAAERALKERGCRLIEVTSNFRLERAHLFYKHLGYETTSFRFKKSLHDA